LADPGSLEDRASIENYLREQVDFSPVTKSKRLTFLRHIQEDKLRKPLVEATRQDVVELVDQMVNKPWWKDRKGIDHKLRNRSPRNYSLALKAYFDWVESSSPGFENPMHNFKIPRGKLEEERPVLPTKDIEKLLKSFDNHHEVGFYRVLLIAGHHMMRAHEILPYLMGAPKTICDCKGECTMTHDFVIREKPHQIRFKVKGTPRVIRYSDWEDSSLSEILWLREAVKYPPCTADTGTRWLKTRAGELRIKLLDKSGSAVGVGFHILARHTLITRLVEAKQHPAVVNRAAHWTPRSQMWSRYAHPSRESVEAAKAASFPKLLGGDRKRAVRADPASEPES
jgi:hypothetical protein